MTLIVGCDPGLNGAFAFLDCQENTIRLVDMHSVGAKGCLRAFVLLWKSR